jgi:hypothetical protein
MLAVSAPLRLTRTMMLMGTLPGRVSFVGFLEAVIVAFRVIFVVEMIRFFAVGVMIDGLDDGYSHGIRLRYWNAHLKQWCRIIPESFIF